MESGRYAVLVSDDPGCGAGGPATIELGMAFKEPRDNKLMHELGIISGEELTRRRSDIAAAERARRMDAKRREVKAAEERAKKLRRQLNKMEKPSS